VLRTKAWRTSSLRLLDDRDRDEALALCDRDPVVNVFVSSRIRETGLNPARLGGQIWAYLGNGQADPVPKTDGPAPRSGPASAQPREQGQIEAICYVGANFVPVGATPAALAAFAGRARLTGRRCSSIVGDAPSVLHLWDLLKPYWGPPREVRASQPVMSISRAPDVAPDPLVRRVRPEELGVLLPASVAMFTEEVGVSPVGADGGGSYRARVNELIYAGHAFARIEDGRVAFKAEVGSVSPYACQVQGVWVRPDLRGRGLAQAGMAAVVAEALRSIAPVVSLYVNDFNLPARAAYRRVGFTEIDTFASVLF
jgi:predicted GNAT family acetyltransferase